MMRLSLAPLLLLAAADRPDSPVFPPFEADKALQEERLTAADLKELEAGKTIVRSRAVPPGKDGAHVMSAALVKAAPEVIFEVVIDCKGNPAYIPHLVECSNTYAGGASEPPVAVYEQTEKLRFGFGFISKDIRYTLRAFHMRPVMRGWVLKKGDIKATEGYYRIIPYKDGKQILLYSVYTDPGTVVPDFIQEALTKRDLPKNVEAFKKRAESLPARTPSRPQ